jgi:hypothetical protein
MPLDLREERVRNVPRGSVLKVKVVTDSDQVNATGQLDLSEGPDQDWTHGKIVNRTASVELPVTGRQFARVNVVIPASTAQEATVEFSIEADGAVIRSWQPSFTGKTVAKDIFIGRAKWIISVVDP